MKRVPTKLKQLAELRARISSQVDKKKSAHEILERELSELNDRLIAYKKFWSQSSMDLAQLTKKLAEIDADIIEFSPTTNPKSIDPIDAWKGKYGKRGALSQFVLGVFESRYPSYLMSSDVVDSVIAKFSIVFATEKDEQYFRRRGIRGTIQSLTATGKLERGEDVILKGQNCGKWRWKTETQPTLASLSAQMKSTSADVH